MRAKGHFPSSFYYSYTTLIPKGLSRTPLSLRPITVLPVPYRIYASLRCQTLLKWQNSWIHPSSSLSVKAVVLLVLIVISLSTSCSAFKPVVTSLASNLTSLNVSIWDTLNYHGCDPGFISLLHHLYTNMQRCFRYAGCIGSFWHATNGLLQGDPLSVVILKCVLCPLLLQLLLFRVFQFTLSLMTLLSSLLPGMCCIKLINS